MINKLFSLLKNKEIILYLVFGVLTTLVNISIFILLHSACHIELLISNTIAWFFSVVFAYITNKIWVFESKSNEILHEFILFVGGRIFSYLVETILLIVFVSILAFNDNYVKIIAQVIVIILNYVLSKSIIFKSK
jgi:putative flippase GtrA